jgi:hypothetical protein
VLFLNRGGGDGKFQVITDRGGLYFRAAHKGRGLAAADLDDDGRPDLVISHVNAPPAVLRNVAAAKHRWLGVELKAPGHGCVAGARAVLEVGGRRQTLFAKGGGSYLSASDRRLLFGLGKDGVPGRLTVHWPGGSPRVEHWDGLEPDRYHTLTQGKGTAE